MPPRGSNWLAFERQRQRACGTILFVDRDRRAIHPVGEVGVHATDHGAVPPRLHAPRARLLRDLVQRASAPHGHWRMHAEGGVSGIASGERDAQARASPAVASESAMRGADRTGEGQTRRPAHAGTQPLREPSASACCRAASGCLARRTVVPLPGPAVRRLTVAEVDPDGTHGGGVASLVHGRSPW